MVHQRPHDTHPPDGDDADTILPENEATKISLTSEIESARILFGVPPILSLQDNGKLVGSQDLSSLDDNRRAMYVDVGTYVLPGVSNCHQHSVIGGQYFDLAYRLHLCYQHELASRCYLACLHFSPYCALAHSLLALGMFCGIFGAAFVIACILFYIHHLVSVSFGAQFIHQITTSRDPRTMIQHVITTI
jgi:hypothetical protein